MATELLKINEVAERLRLCRSQVYKMVQHGEFPPPIKLSRRASRWNAEAVENFLQAKQDEV